MLFTWIFLLTLLGMNVDRLHIPGVSKNGVTTADGAAVDSTKPMVNKIARTYVEQRHAHAHLKLSEASSNKWPKRADFTINKLPAQSNAVKQTFVPTSAPERNKILSKRRPHDRTIEMFQISTKKLITSSRKEPSKDETKFPEVFLIKLLTGANTKISKSVEAVELPGKQIVRNIEAATTTVTNFAPTRSLIRQTRERSTGNRIVMRITQS